MNWIARYVAQVKAYLPGSNRDDVAEELSSLLEERVSDQEAELGRELNQAETFTLLREFGHPLKVASAYQGFGPLISEALFPMYILVIRYLVIILVAAFAVSWIAFYISGERNLWPMMSLGDLLDIGTFYFGAITIGFHLTGRFILRKDFLANWNPAGLPKAEAQRESIFVTATVILFIVLWLRILSFIPVEHSLDELLGRNGNRFTTFVLWLKLQALICLPAYIWLLIKPYWSNGKRLIIIASDLVIIVGALICVSIGNEVFAAWIVEALPQFESAAGFARASGFILYVWILAIGWDMVSHINRIWRGN